VEGFGTVVTGTLWRGSIRPGDRVVVEPGGVDTRVRSVQVHNRDVPAAVAGQRTAVALHGVDRARIGRGHWVLAPGSLSASYMLDARIHLLAGAPRAMANRQRVRFHLGASEILGRVVLLDREELKPGDSTVAQLRLEAPVLADRGDRFVLRSYSPQRAVGGGTVLVPAPAKHRRHDAEAVARLEVEEGGGTSARAEQALAAFPFGAGVDAIARGAGLPPGEILPALERLRESGAVTPLADGRWLTAAGFDTLSGQVESACRRHQEGARFRWGPSRGDLKSQLPREVDAVLFDALVEGLVERDRLFRRGDRFRVGSPDLDLTEREAALLERARRAFEATPFAPPSLKEIDEAARAGPLLHEVLGCLVLEGTLVKLSADIYYSARALAEMERKIRVFFVAREEMSVADLKDLFGISRRHAVPVLEYFDRAGVTRRLGDVRVAGRAISRSGP
jgi:selenocysteine-specific elongation factor